VRLSDVTPDFVACEPHDCDGSTRCSTCRDAATLAAAYAARDLVEADAAERRARHAYALRTWARRLDRVAMYVALAALAAALGSWILTPRKDPTL
jgi:hypothetical protein